MDRNKKRRATEPLNNPQSRTPRTTNTVFMLTTRTTNAPPPTSLATSDAKVVATASTTRLPSSSMTTTGDKRHHATICRSLFTATSLTHTTTHDTAATTTVRSHPNVATSSPRESTTATVKAKSQQMSTMITAADLEATMKSRARACQQRSAGRGTPGEPITWTDLVNQWHKQCASLTEHKTATTHTIVPFASCALCEQPMLVPLTVATNEKTDAKSSPADVTEDIDHERRPVVWSDLLHVSVDRIDSSHCTLPYGPRNFQLCHRLCNSDKSILDRISQERYLSTRLQVRTDWVAKRIKQVSLAKSTSKQTTSTAQLTLTRTREQTRWKRACERVQKMVAKTRAMIYRLAGCEDRVDVPLTKTCLDCRQMLPVARFPCRRQLYQSVSSVFGQVYLPWHAQPTCFACTSSQFEFFDPDICEEDDVNVDSNSTAAHLLETSRWIGDVYFPRFKRLVLARRWIAGDHAPDQTLIPSAADLIQTYRKQFGQCAVCTKPLRHLVTRPPDWTTVIDGKKESWTWVHRGCAATAQSQKDTHLYNETRRERLQLQKKLDTVLGRLRESKDIQLTSIGWEWECKHAASQFVALQFQLREEYTRWNALWQQTLAARDAFTSLNTRLSLTRARFPHWYED